MEIKSTPVDSLTVSNYLIKCMYLYTLRNESVGDNKLGVNIFQQQNH